MSGVGKLLSASVIDFYRLFSARLSVQAKFNANNFIVSKLRTMISIGFVGRNSLHCSNGKIFVFVKINMGSYGKVRLFFVMATKVKPTIVKI